ncbi:hypothetical protein BDZ45DRAFT_811003 [Acephala macrosclerotiorum]|nr:hypothetical protein BDZ45DRAFT_811003 [Acephala macrosclerotiorum]
MQFTYPAATLLAIAPLVLAHPTFIPTVVPKATGPAVQAIPLTVSGPNLSELAHQPANLTADAKAFLSKYQTYSNVASTLLGPKQNDKFSAAGWCFQETPCFSVGRVSVVAMPAASGQPLPALTTAQVSSLLDSLLATTNTAFDNSNHDTVFTGLKTTLNGAVMEVIAPQSTVPSSLVAGMVLDTFKASIGSSANAVRSVEAQEDGGPVPTVAICLYPDGADAAASQNFCVGKELDGSVALSTPATIVNKRSFSLFGDLCSLIDIPLLC